MDLPDSDFIQPHAPALRVVRAFPSSWLIDCDGDVWACTWFGTDGVGWTHWLRDTGVRPMPEDVVADIELQLSAA